MARRRNYKRDRNGRFARVAGSAGRGAASVRRNAPRKGAYAKKDPLRRAQLDTGLVFAGQMAGANLGSRGGKALGGSVGGQYGLTGKSLGQGLGSQFGARLGGSIGQAYGDRRARKTGARITAKEFATFSPADQARVKKHQQKVAVTSAAVTAYQAGMLYSNYRANTGKPTLKQATLIKATDLGNKRRSRGAARYNAKTRGLGKTPTAQRYAKKSRAGVYTVTSMR